ncbi:hypothetical protein [Rheinheimera sp. 4Y26]|uniref:hypothetical protein n=1 Tax=Rheinheimera sp. 4Y26 TaxID=2977811 RepID=UPI0021B1361E|nr:hypothetical protein [Rheinheimera sp. 4Y26]MCT6701034.1 hypothetical protein [Rheinheimera sp. 4Y26]
MFRTAFSQLTKAAALLALVAASAAQAHTDEYLDTVVGPNGGQLRMAGAYHFELLVVKNSKDAKNNAIKVFVMDHANTPIATAGATANLVLVAGKQKARVELKPEGNNALVGEAVYASVPEMKVVANITMPGQSAQTAKFEPLKPTAAAAKDHDHHEHGEKHQHDAEKTEDRSHHH